MVLAIETIETPRPEDEQEAEDVAQFYQDPEEYSELLASPEIGYGLLEPLKVAMKSVKKGSVLDLGCGPGTVAQALSPKLTFTGVDTARPMLIKAVLEDQRYKKAYWGRIEDVVPVLHRRRETFDWAVALSSLYYVEDPLPLIQQLADICTTGMVLSFDEITLEYKAKAQKEFGIALPLFNHSHLAETLELEGWEISDVWKGHAWHAPRVGLSINATVVTLRKI